MTSTVIDHETAASGLGARFLRKRSGPEAELVSEFLARIPFSPRFGWRSTVFREPRLASGSPDLVVVQWNEAVTAEWSACRAALTPEDMRLVHFLSLSGPTDEATIREAFQRPIAASLGRLEAADMARFEVGHWRPRPLSKLYAVRRIIAIEAKVKEWAAALDQARLNTWFASDSYVLLPSLGPREKILEAAAAFGIGVWVKDVLALQAPKDPEISQPRSYASWLFNEWAWRASFSDTERG